MPTEEEIIELPYVVFRRGDSGSYGLRFTLPDRDDPEKRSPQYRIGLKTKDEAEAYKKANVEYYRALGRHEEGFMVGPARFDKVATSYVEKLLAEGRSSGEKRKYGNARHAQGTVERYLIPFFKDAAIGAIRALKIDEYKAWRKTYWTKGPGKDIDVEEHVRGNSTVKMRFAKKDASDATIKRELNFLRGVFKHAVDKGYIRPSDIPKLKTVQADSKKRPAFTAKEFAKLEQVAIQRYYDACQQEISAQDKADYEKQLAQKTKLIFERKQMIEFINIAVKTGMRPGELFNMNWGHVVGLDSVPIGPLAEMDIRIFAEGKNKEGYVIPVRHTESHFLSLADAYKERFDEFPKKDNPVFCDAIGNRLVSLNKQLNQLLKAAGLLYDVSGKKKFSTYCFRHTYATWQLINDENVGIHTLAVNMRTSVEMIQNHYSKLKAEMKAEQLRGKPLGSLSSGTAIESNRKSSGFGDWENE